MTGVFYKRTKLVVKFQNNKRKKNAWCYENMSLTYIGEILFKQR